MPVCNYRKCKKGLAMKTKRQEYCNPRCRVKESKLKTKDRNASSVPAPVTPTAATMPGVPFALPADLATAVFFGVWSLLALLKLATQPVGNVAEQLTMLHLNLTSHRGHPVVDFIYRKIEEATAEHIRILSTPWCGRTARILGSAIGFDVRARIDGTQEEVCLNSVDFERRWPATPTPEEPDNLEQEWPFVNPKVAVIDVCLAIMAITRRLRALENEHGPRVENIAEELGRPLLNTMSAVEMAVDEGYVLPYEAALQQETRWYCTEKGVTLGTVPEPQPPQAFEESPSAETTRTTEIDYPKEEYLLEKISLHSKLWLPPEKVCPCCELPMAEEGDICSTCNQWAGAILATVRAALGKSVRAKHIVAQYPHMRATALFATNAGAWLVSKGSIAFDETNETIVAYYDPTMRTAYNANK